MTPTNIHILYDALTKDVITVKFTKADGTEAVQSFTLDQSRMPEGTLVENASREPQTVETAVEKDVIRAWSFTKNDWRSFKPSRVIETRLARLDGSW